VFPWAEYIIFSISDDACIAVVKVCAISAQPGHTIIIVVGASVGI
jgi:hypothetical protein